MKREDAGGPCEFHILVKSKFRLLPIAFQSWQIISNKVHFHSHPGECLAATWSAIKNRQFLWGRPFTLMTDCAAINWLVMSYKGHNNHTVVRLQLELLSYWFTIAVRPGTLLEDANLFSRLGEDLHIDPMLKDYPNLSGYSELGKHCVQHPQSTRLWTSPPNGTQSHDEWSDPYCLSFNHTSAI
jgi:hypothetical protein